MPKAQRLSPLVFSAAEAEALLLGLLWVADPEYGGDDAIAESAIRKIVAALPAPSFASTAAEPEPDASPHLPTLRHAIRAERTLHLRYTAKSGETTQRTVWPIALYGDDMLIAKCELREDFRQFRLDRIETAELGPTCYPTRRLLLLAAWRLQQS